MLVEIGLLAGATVGLLVIKHFADKYNQKRQRKKAMSGDYGQETQWAAELVDEGDELFTLAVAEMNQVDPSELRDVGIIAESKEELRELTVERFDELTEDSLPEEFQ